MSSEPEWRVPHTLLAAVIQWLDEEETGGHELRSGPPASFEGGTSSARPPRTRDGLEQAQMGKGFTAPAKPRRPRERDRGRGR